MVKKLISVSIAVAALILTIDGKAHAQGYCSTPGMTSAELQACYDERAAELRRKNPSCPEGIKDCLSAVTLPDEGSEEPQREGQGQIKDNNRAQDVAIVNPSKPKPVIRNPAKYQDAVSIYRGYTSRAKPIGDNIEFNKNQATLTSAGVARLNEHCVGLSKLPQQSTIVIAGHADASGPRSYNLQLSQQRADAVKIFLSDTCGFDRRRIETIGAGEEVLLSGYEKYSGIHRRVEVMAF